MSRTSIDSDELPIIRPLQRTVTIAFREQLRQSFPNLDRESAFWGFLEYLLFSTVIDRRTGQLRISQRLLARIEGKIADLYNHRYSAQRFLDRFSSAITPICYSGWSLMRGETRVIRDVDLPPALAVSLQEELRSLTTVDRVLFQSGQMADRRALAAIREDIRAEAMHFHTAAPSIPTYDLLDYLNTLPSHRFRKILYRMPIALDATSTIPHPRVQQHHLRMLAAIRDQPQPFYIPVANSVRVFTLNPSLQGLKRTLRSILIHDWIRLDLRSAQLSIIAHDWQIPMIQHFLEQGNSIWEELFTHFHREPDNVWKDIFKQALYALVFGGELPRLIRIFTDTGCTRSDAYHFLAHPLMQATLTARKRQRDHIVTNGGAEDCFGRWLALNGSNNWRSVLAQLAQARELQILMPAVALARETTAFTITLWLHDGFAIDVRDAQRTELWTRRIREVVDREAANLGIATRLVQE